MMGLCHNLIEIILFKKGPYAIELVLIITVGNWATSYKPTSNQNPSLAFANARPK